MKYKPPITTVIYLDDEPSMIVLTFNGDLSPEMVRKIESIYDNYCSRIKKKVFE